MQWAIESPALAAQRSSLAASSASRRAVGPSPLSARLLTTETPPTPALPAASGGGRRSHAEWRRPSDVKDAFGTTVDFLADNRLIFDIGGNKFRLVVRVSYRFKQVLIKFVGTHREYDAIDPETV